MGLGNNLKRLRGNKSLSQKELAEMVCVSPQAISRWENDEVEPDISTLNKLSGIFGVTVDALINGEEKTEETNVESEPAEESKTAESNIEKVECVEPEVVNENSKNIEEGFKTVKAKKPFNNSFGLKQMIFGAIAGVILFVIALIVNLNNQVEVFPSIGYGLLFGYAAFSIVYCCFTGSYIADVFVDIASFSVKFPGVIFTLDLGGLAFLIVVKLLFAVLGFLVSVACLIFAVLLSAFLSMISFPFVLVHNIKNGIDL